jgi:hypothetical protein
VCVWLHSRKSIRKMEEVTVPLIVRTVLGLEPEESEDLEHIKDVSHACVRGGIAWHGWSMDSMSSVVLVSRFFDA